MHDLQRFIQEQLDTRGWRQADLVQRSGLSRAHVSKLLKDQGDLLKQLPDRETLDGIARGLGVRVELVLSAAVSALGVPPATLPLMLPSTESLTNDQLLAELARRLNEERKPDAASTTNDGGAAPVTLIKSQEDAGQVLAKAAHPEETHGNEPDRPQPRGPEGDGA